jgi:hypothetical protein
VTVLSCGIGLIAAGFAAIVARHIAGGIVVGQLVEEQSVKPAAEAAWTIGTSLMISIATTVIVFGVLFAISGWLASPTGAARTTRRAFAPLLRDHMPYVYAALAIVVCIYFLAAPTQGLRSFLTTLIIGAMAAVGIHELGKQTAEEYPDAQLGDVFGGTRERVASAVREANLGERASRLRLPEVRLPQRPPAADGNAGQPPHAPVSEEDARLARLEKLAELNAKGVLTDEEFAAEKARLLAAD